MKLLLLAFVFLSFQGFTQTLSRQTISSAGSGTSTGGVTIQQTIGQPYQTKTSQSGSIALRPGFAQPVFSSELLSSTIQVVISPNPALFSFFVETSDSLFNTVLSVSDARGRVIFTENISLFKKHEVHCAAWANGMYMVTITDQKQNLISAKIIKHQ